MSEGLYPDRISIERFEASPATGNVTQRFVAPYDFDVTGMLLWVSTAPGAATTMTVNVNDFPTSQQGGANPSVGAFNLWTAANVPSIVNTATSNIVTTNSQTLIENLPYALNYPLPGPAGSVGYATAQAQSQVTTNPVVAPPTVYKFQMTNPIGPDNTYVGYNGITEAASLVRAGDVLTFVVGGSVGASANLVMQLLGIKR